MVQVLNKGSKPPKRTARGKAPAARPQPAEASPDRVQRRLDARRLEILRAAGRTFRRRGYAAAGMREIAREADLSPGNLYHYFKGKHEILFFCQDRSLEAMLAALRHARRSRQPAAHKLHEVLTAHVRCILDEMEGSAAHLEVNDMPAELRQAIVAKRDRYERGIRRLISAGMGSGEFACADPGLVTRAILGALNWTARWYSPGGSQPAAEVARQLGEFLVRGLQLPAAAAVPGGDA